MSYELYLFLPVSGEAPEATARRRSATLRTEVVNPGPPNAEAEARKEELVRALLAQNPGLERFAFDIAEIARFEGIPEEKARSQNRQIELNEPGDGPGIQIILYDDWANVSLPSGDGWASEQALWAQVWRYLRVFEAGGFFVYDPQIEAVIDLDEDHSDAGRTPRAGAADPGPDRAAASARSARPWWKFW
jgi:hypothetical protein